MKPPTPEEIDRLLDGAVAVVDRDGRLLGERDLRPAEKKAPAVSVAVVQIGEIDPPWLHGNGCDD